MCHLPLVVLAPEDHRHAQGTSTRREREVLASLAEAVADDLLERQHDADWTCPVIADTVTVAVGHGEVLVMGKVFSQEFKAQIVELHRRGRSFMDLGKEFGLSPSTVSNWARAADRREVRTAAGSVDENDDAARIARLERELASKEEELTILGKALAFFARRAAQ